MGVGTAGMEKSMEVREGTKSRSSLWFSSPTPRHRSTPSPSQQARCLVWAHRSVRALACTLSCTSLHLPLTPSVPSLSSHLAGFLSWPTRPPSSLVSVLRKHSGTQEETAALKNSHRTDRKSTRLNSSHTLASRMPSSA